MTNTSAVHFAPHLQSRTLKLSEQKTRSREMLFRALSRRSVVAVVGAGLPRSLSEDHQKGYPTMKDLVARLQAWIAPCCPLPCCVVERYASMFGSSGDKEIPAEEALNCIDLLARENEQSDALASHIGTIFRPRNSDSLSGTAYEALLALPIQRFITTNYDIELERAICEFRGIPIEHFGREATRDNWVAGESAANAPRDQSPRSSKPQSTEHPSKKEAHYRGGPLRRSFTQEIEFAAEQAIFPLARIDHRGELVFHCHGRYDRKESIVLTESQYQRWYERDDPESRGLNRALSLTLTGNSLLFIGFSLRDIELLSPIRQLHAQAEKLDCGTPAFAIMDESEAGKDRARNEYLFARYGVHVLTFEAANESIGAKLAAYLQGLREGLEEWRNDWLDRPAPATAPFSRAPVTTPRTKFLGKRIVDGDVEMLLRNLRAQRMVVLVGEGGCGKSLRAQLLHEKLSRNPAASTSLFWSAYFSDDWLSAVDRAIAFLGGRLQDQSPDRIQQLGKLLRSKKNSKHFIILDGFERLLKECEDVIEGGAEVSFGVPVSASVRQLLATFLDPRNVVHTLITSRLAPLLAPLKRGDSPKPTYKIARVTPLDLASLNNATGFTSVERNVRDRLLMLTNGHPYALQLIQWLVSDGGWKVAGSEYEVEPLRTLLNALALLPEAQRVSRVVQEAVQVCDRCGNELLGMRGLVTGLAQRLASFMSPVSEEVIKLCWNDLLKTMAPNFGLADQAASPKIPRLKGGSQAIRTLLLDACLLQQAGLASNGPSIMHPLVRSFVFSRLHHAQSEQLPHFGLSGFTSGIAAVHPGSPEAGAMIVRVIRELCDSNEAQAAFSVIRARTESNSVCRWSNFHEYLELLVRVMNIARNQNTAGFSPDDVAWLYNELGLACGSHGDMLDAFAVWNQGLEISRQIDRRHSGAHTVQSLLHLGHTYIELGRLRLAEEMLHDAARHNRQLADLDFAGRIHGYLGLVAHLRGDRATADRQYDLSLQEIHDAGGNPRARSVFCRYKGDLALASGDVQQAKELIDQSHAIAEAAQFPDLVAFARKSRGHLYRNGGDLGKARAEYEFALSEARRFRILRLEADVHSELARFALDVGDPHTALRRAECSLRISNRLGLGLRQTHGMVVLGIANFKLGEVAWGQACLDHAVAIGRSQGYLSRVLEAERVLWECGLGPKVP